MCRLLAFAGILLSSASAQAQVSYGGNLALPQAHGLIVRQTTAQLDTASPDYNAALDDQIFYLLTANDYYTYDFAGSSSPSPVSSQRIAFSGLGLGAGTKSVVYGRKLNDPPGPSFLMTGSRNSLINYHVSPGTAYTQFVSFAPETSVAVNQGQGLSLVASPTRIFSAPTTTDASSTFTPMALTTGDLTNAPVSFGQITEMSFAPGPNGLLYVLDWGNQKVDAFSLSVDGGGIASGTLQLSFNLPGGLESNTLGLGFVVNNFGHIFLADGKGGGIETDLLGNVLATFDPPADDVLDPYASSADKPFISYDSTGRIFVEDGANGLHWYQDLSAVPEPSTWALLGLGGLILIVAGRKRQALSL